MSYLLMSMWDKLYPVPAEGPEPNVDLVQPVVNDNTVTTLVLLEYFLDRNFHVSANGLPDTFYWNDGDTFLNHWKDFVPAAAAECIMFYIACDTQIYAVTARFEDAIFSVIITHTVSLFTKFAYLRKADMKMLIEHIKNRNKERSGKILTLICMNVFDPAFNEIFQFSYKGHTPPGPPKIQL